MSWVAAAVVGGAVIGANASSKANKAQGAAVDKSNALQKEMYDQTRADQTPYREAGYSALAQIQNLLKSPGSITQDPGYQFGMDQGTRALNSGAAARGMTYSGAAGKALARYGQDYAGTKLDQSYNRLAGIAGLGQVGANGQNNQNYGNNVGNNMIGLGNAQGASALRSGSIYSNSLNQLGAWGAQRWGGGNTFNVDSSGGYTYKDPGSVGPFKP
jgi:hypothetical protein